MDLAFWSQWTPGGGDADVDDDVCDGGGVVCQGASLAYGFFYDPVGLCDASGKATRFL